MITANFKSYNNFVTDTLYQWDINQKLTVAGLNIEVAPEVHFSNSEMERAIVRQASLKSGVITVDIPNSLLQSASRIYAHIGIYESETFKVIEAVEIPVIARKKPFDYVLENSDDEVYSFKALEYLMSNALTKTEGQTINARIDTIVANANSTDGNSELVDIRVDVNGTTHASAGTAIREQFLTLPDIYNVTYKKPLESDYYTLSTAINAIPKKARKGGLIITFRPTYESWEMYQYTVKDASDSNWNNLSYWKNITYDSKVHNLYRGRVTELGFTNFAECTDYGYYRFYTSDISSISDAPDGLSKAGNIFVYQFFGGSSAQFIRDLDGNEWFRHSGLAWICTNKNNEARITALENKKPKIKWCAMGDSITEGYYSYLDDSGEVAYKLDTSIGWPNYVETINGYTLTNKGVGGSGYLSTRSSDNPVANAKEVANATNFAEFNLVTLAFGVNDWKYNCVLGTIDDDKTLGTTIYSNMKYVIEKILSDNPLCKIIVITPLNSTVKGSFETNWGLGGAYSNNGTLEDIYNAMVNVCEYYGIEYIDMTHNSIVNRCNINRMLLDSVHPTKECHKVLGYELAKKINF